MGGEGINSSNRFFRVAETTLARYKYIVYTVYVYIHIIEYPRNVQNEQDRLNFLGHAGTL